MMMKELLPGIALAAVFACTAPALPVTADDDAPSMVMPIPLPGTRIDSVLVSVNGEPVTLLDVIL